jgi:hypothetical protein
MYTSQLASGGCCAPLFQWHHRHSTLVSKIGLASGLNLCDIVRLDCWCLYGFRSGGGSICRSVGRSVGRLGCCACSSARSSARSSGRGAASIAVQAAGSLQLINSLPHAVGVADHASKQSIDLAPATAATFFGQWTNGCFKLRASVGINGHGEKAQGVSHLGRRVQLGPGWSQTSLAAALDKA